MARTVNYLGGYPAELAEKAQALCDSGELLPRIQARYPESNPVVDNARLYTYAQDLKRTYMRSSPPLAKVRYCEKIATVHRALGLNTSVVRQQGSKLKRKNELRVGAVFKEGPEAFLRAIVVHELAHLRHWDHDKAFYRLCEHMEPDYHRLELDIRLWLFARSRSDKPSE